MNKNKSRQRQRPTPPKQHPEPQQQTQAQAQAQAKGKSGEGAEEKRKAPDGTMYTRAQFLDFFNGTNEWDRAASTSTTKSKTGAGGSSNGAAAATSAGAKAAAASGGGGGGGKKGTRKLWYGEFDVVLPKGLPKDPKNVVSAHYGNPKKVVKGVGVDVLAIVRKNITHGREFKVENKVFGSDPCVGVRKVLALVLKGPASKNEGARGGGTNAKDHNKKGRGKNKQLDVAAFAATAYTSSPDPKSLPLPSPTGMFRKGGEGGGGGGGRGGSAPSAYDSPVSSAAGGVDVSPLIAGSSGGSPGPSPILGGQLAGVVPTAATLPRPALGSGARPGARHGQQQSPQPATVDAGAVLMGMLKGGGGGKGNGGGGAAAAFPPVPPVPPATGQQPMYMAIPGGGLLGGGMSGGAPPPLPMGAPPHAMMAGGGMSGMGGVMPGMMMQGQGRGHPGQHASQPSLLQHVQHPPMPPHLGMVGGDASATAHLMGMLNMQQQQQQQQQGGGMPSHPNPHFQQQQQQQYQQQLQQQQLHQQQLHQLHQHQQRQHSNFSFVRQPTSPKRSHNKALRSNHGVHQPRKHN